MAGRRRGRTGRGWDAAPPRPRRTAGPDPRPGPDDPGLAHPGPDDPGLAHPGPDDPVSDDPGPRRRPTGSPAATDPAEAARQICLRLLAVRPRTRAELAAALHRRGIAEEVAAEVLDRYGEVGMIDDEAFARAWVASRHHGRGLARRALDRELRRRGVAAETVGEALAQVDADTEADTARVLVRRRLRVASGPPEAVLRRLVGMLARKGYPAGLAFRVVKEVLAEDGRTAGLAERLDPEALADAAGDEGNPDPA